MSRRVNLGEISAIWNMRRVELIVYPVYDYLQIIMNAYCVLNIFVNLYCTSRLTGSWLFIDQIKNAV